MTGQTISHYKILEKLGEGGMGVVYKAQDTKLDRFVAIKFLSAHLSGSEESKARLLQEAKATAALNHPNIMNVYEIDETESGMFFVMEYLEGRSLRSYISNLKSNTGIPYTQTIEWTIQIANGLQAAHEKNIVHRDIKPENIMVTESGQLKIMDFGIAKLKSGSALTRTGTSLGTLSYMSPEQAQGMSTDRQSDIWALGVVVFEMLTMDLPFKAEHEAALLYLIVNDDPPLTSSMDKKIPHSIDPFVMKMLAKRPEHRFASMSDVIEALTNVKKEIETTGNITKTKGITVLPFGNMSPDKESEYFCDGLTEELIVTLSKLKEIRVIPRSKAMHYKGTSKDVKVIGRELGTRYVLSGNVRRFQDNLRISVELIDIENDEQLWAETYKGKLADVFEIQEMVSKQIVDTMLIKISPKDTVKFTKRSTENAEAFDCYLRGRDFLNRRSKNSVNFSIDLFRKAIELDSRYASAYAGLGEAYATYYQVFERKETWLEKAIESSLKALMYDPTLSEAYAALALAYFNRKKYPEALESGQKATELDPNNHIAYWILGRIYRTMDRDRESVELFEKSLMINPDFYSAFGDLAMVYERLGEVEKFKEISERALEFYFRHSSKHPDDGRVHMMYALALVRAKRIEDAKRVAKKALNLSPDDAIMMYNASCFYTMIGEKQLAAQTLKNAVEAGYGNFEWIKRDPDLESIRTEPLYIEIMNGK
jgi:serine/threonine protein kinase/Flp pilus assembly protein TadD